MKLLERLFWIAALVALFALGRWEHVSVAVHGLRNRLRAELHALGVPCFAPDEAPRAAEASQSER